MIRCIYTKEPNFPASDNHPDAVRYEIGGKWVDAIGGEPTPQEIDAVLNPPVVKRLDVDDLAAALKRKGALTDEDIEGARK